MNSPSSTTAITCFMSYGFVASSGMSVQLRGLALDGIGWRRERGSLEVVLGEEREQVAGVLEHPLLVRRGEVRHARLGRVRLRAAELLEGDFLPRDGLHDVGAGDEHVRARFRHQHEVGDRRRVDAARGQAEDERDLGSTPDAWTFRQRSPRSR